MNQPEVIQIGNLVENVSFDNPQRGRVYDTKGICPCLNGLDSGNNMPKILEIMEEPRARQVAQIYNQEYNPINGRIYDPNRICPTLRTPTGGISEPKIVSYTRDDKGRVENYHYKDTSNTLHTGGGTTAQYVSEPNKNTMYRIRKLTPRECLRLMRFSEKSIDAMQAAKVPFETKKGIVYKPMPKTQLYKQAGNSIDCGMIYELGRTMWIDNQPENGKPHQPSLFD